MTVLAQVKEWIRDFGIEYFNRYYSTYRGQVVDNNDPDKMGRLKVTIPGIHDATHDHWAWPVGLIGGNNYGLVSIPAIGDVVYIQFENGHPNYPMWQNGWWKMGEMPSEVLEDYPEVFIMKTKTGYKLLMNPTQEFISLSHPNRSGVIINNEGVSLLKGDHGVSLGSLDKSAEPAVLGDQNAIILDKTLSHLTDLCSTLIEVLSAGTMPIPGTGAPVIASSTAQIGELVVQIIQTQIDIAKTKSEFVTLD